MTYLYRCEEVVYSAGIDEFNRVLSGYTLRIYCRKYKILKNTPKGVWVDYYSERKFVLLSGRKRFAWPTIEEAIISFKARKKKQISILEGQLIRARNALYKAENENIDMSLCL